MQLEAKYVFILNAIEALFFGLSFIIAPIMIMEMVGPTTLVVGVAGEVLGVHYGIVLTALAILMLLIRNQPHSDFRQNVFLFFILLWTGTFFYQVYMIFAFGFGNLMWITTIATDIILIALYAFQYFTNKGS
jgi:hypothetical protein